MYGVCNDPHAAAMVFAAPVPRLVAVGLEVTNPCTLPADECRTRFEKAGGPLLPVRDMAEAWFDHTPHVTFHDPLAAALVFDDGLCTMAQGRIEIDPSSLRAPGQVYFVPDENGPHCVAQTVNVTAFFAHYFGVVGREHVE